MDRLVMGWFTVGFNGWDSSLFRERKNVTYIFRSTVVTEFNGIEAIEQFRCCRKRPDNQALIPDIKISKLRIHIKVQNKNNK